MLPGSSPERVDREAAKGKQSGRTVEIQRLIGRSLRAACDMRKLGERQVVVDCDVLQADGGTRTASICGGYLALHDALDPAGADRGDQGAPAALALRGDQRRHRRRRAGARPALRRGLARRGRHERGDARPAPAASRCSSRCRARPRAARSPAPSSTPLLALAERRARPRSWRCRPSCSPSRRRRRPSTDADAELVCASANPDKVAEIAAMLDGVGRAAAATRGRARRGRGRRHVGRQRPAEGGRDRARRPAGRRWPTTPACSSTRSTARPGVWTARYAGEDATYAENCTKLLDALGRRRRRSRPGGGVPHRRAGALAVRRRARRRGRVPGSDRHGRCARVAASATTRCSSPTRATAARSAR